MMKGTLDVEDSVFELLKRMSKLFGIRDEKVKEGKLDEGRMYLNKGLILEDSLIDILDTMSNNDQLGILNSIGNKLLPINEKSSYTLSILEAFKTGRMNS